VQVFDGTTLLGSAIVSGTSFTFDANLGEGQQHSITATATDAAGNTATSSSAITFTVDRTPPAAPAITSPAEGQTFNAATGNTVVVSGTAEANAKVQVLNSGTPIGDPVTADGSGNWQVSLKPADGRYSFTATATDAAGNAGAASSPPVGITVDTIAPTVNINSATDGNNNPVQRGGSTTSTSITFTFIASDGGSGIKSIQCMSDIAPQPVDCASPKTYSNLPNGNHFFQVRATDNAGNVFMAPPWIWTVDTIAPTVTASPAGGTYNKAQSVTLTANEPATIYYTTDGTTPTTSSAKYTGPITINTEGTKTLKFLGVETAGNAETVQSQSYTIIPTILSTKPSNGQPNVNAGQPDFGIQATFSEDMNPSTMTFDTISVTSSGGTVSLSKIQYDSTSKTVTLTPSTTLNSATTYTVIIGIKSGVTDINGNRLQPQGGFNPWSFTTK
jgi:Chitobiase/beta-hexosaminidase C-terminal domain/Bacterial Ig-like domain